ncbi:uncharacterized protein B0303.7 [Onthophagus taurus]|uniref:uncharacterized protein B0303.7 n=1 Tax=Onthophagus taurus TaxID=166361 RepID=UPI000C206C66|nr:SH3 domain-containing protein 19 [Onthophagus taurus]
MKNMRIPTRPAPSIEEARRNKNNQQQKNTQMQKNIKKKPPPRPPPPDLSKIQKSKSTWVLNQKDDDCMIEWSPPCSPKTSRLVSGSISSSFNSSTSSLASSKKSFDMESSPFNISPWNSGLQTSAQINMPTIIRAQPPKKSAKASVKVPSIVPGTSRMPNSNYSPPMPTIPPPSPPKDVSDGIVPFGLALFNYAGNHPDDLPLQENDIVYLIKRLDKDWLYGKVGDREGMFPRSFIEIKIPLTDEEDVVTALYEFVPQMVGDLALKPGQTIKVLRRVSDEWLLGESDGIRGQFPANFIDRIPLGI